jgi:restriction system protein
MTMKPQDPIPSFVYSNDNEAQHVAVQAAAVRARGVAAAIFSSQLHQPDELPLPGILLQAVVIPGEQTDEGLIIRAVTIPWFEIIKLFERDPNAIYQLDWRKWEEMIAGAYAEQDFDVILTPRSGDKGRDVIATSRGGYGSIRFFEQVKAYKPGNLVPADDIRAMLGVLSAEGNVSKGIVTTTSEFAPGILADENIKRFMPHRLELKARDALLDWLRTIAAGRK